MEMARKHEHFGLSYLEELSILKERENMCKKSRQQFLTFKRKAANDQTRLNKPPFQITPSDLSPQLEPNSSHTNLPVEQDTCISLKTVNLLPDVWLTKHQAQYLEAQQKKSPKKEDSKIGSHLDENEKGPVAIASLIGTAKQVSMLKKPEHPPRSKCIRFVSVKSISEKTFISQQEVHDTEQPEQKIYYQQKTTGNVGTSSVTTETDSSRTVDSSTSEMSLKMAKEISKPNILMSILELENSDSKKFGEISNMKSVPGSSQETRGVRRSSTFEKSFPLSRSEALDSAQTFPAGVVPRSIDEIIASLQSTTPTPSDLRIKELLESILGENYNIKIESPVIVPLKPEEKEKTPKYSLQESESEERQSPAEQATPADSEQTQLDSSQSSRREIRESIFPPIEEENIVEEDTPKARDSSQSSRREIRESIFPPIEEENIVEEDTPKTRVQEEFTEEPAETPVVEYPHKEPSLQESEEDVSYSDIQELYEPGPLVPKVLEEEETSEELEEFDSVHSLKVRGKAFPKVEPVTVQKSSEDLPQQQPVSLLSTWTTKIKDVDHPFIHHLCTASPRCALPVDLQLVSRVSHTLDKKSHHVPLPAFHPGYYESEDLFPAITLLEKQRETERY
ncbi:uncharacterized protein LOC125426362 [Sphaerodactylus townsendi]|uniref:uncharacterized protein LOC125426362 n=1 Tax=Sphaerodactylus townsendi TaxID=933632 RepID=UPI0020272CAE|nr:uncharacterized protein LOC125426362 [Sphaerodactylus townsendi]